MPFSEVYRKQATLVVRVLPEVAHEECFALKGGTGINLFIREHAARIRRDGGDYIVLLKILSKNTQDNEQIDRTFSATSRSREPRRHIQVVAGARQVGKTTLVQQVTEDITVPVRFASADEPMLPRRRKEQPTSHRCGCLRFVTMLGRRR
jgi:hypothetical protein